MSCFAYCRELDFMKKIKRASSWARRAAEFGRCRSSASTISRRSFSLTAVTCAHTEDVLTYISQKQVPGGEITTNIGEQA
eukprot:129744-Rhodomonas_salina.1